MNNKKINLVGIILLFLLISISQPVYSWWGAPVPGTGINDHSELTEQALTVVANNDSLNKYSEISSGILNIYDNIIELSSGAFDFRSKISGPLGKSGYINSSTSHFYNPSTGASYGNQWPSALNESYDWLNLAISAYAKGEKTAAYIKLGYIIHLLEDMSVPAHTYLIMHGIAPWDDLEWKVDADNIDATTRPPIQAYSLKGNDIYAIQQQFKVLGNNSYKNTPNATIKTILDTYYSDSSYIGSNYDCSLPGDCSPQLSSSDVTILQDNLMPLAVQYSAGLAMRVYDIFQSLDWPTENHDYRRTSFTLLKGDMNSASQVEKIAFVLAQNVTQPEQVMKAIVADIDGNGAMETVNFVYNTVGAGNTNIYAVETKKQSNNKVKTTTKWKQTITGPTIFPGTLADLDGESGSRKELITGTHNSSGGKVYAFNIASNGQSTTQRWSYTLNAKWSPSASEYVLRYDGGTAVIDIDKDGKNEIVLADVYEADPDWPGAVYVLKDNSDSVSLLANYTFGSAGAYATVSSADVDGDGYPELFVPGMYGMFAFHYNTSVSSKLSKMWNNTDAKIESSPVIADVDNDNEYEIIYTTNSGSCAAGKTCYNRVYVRDAKTGNSETTITSITNLPRPTPSVGNLDSDSNLEIIVLAQDSISSSAVYGDVYCYDAVTGSLQWTFNLNNQFKTAYMSPSIADINNDGNNEVVLAENDGNRLFVLKNDGTELFHYQFEGFVDNAIAIADVDQDGVAELALKRAGSPITLFSTLSSYNKPPELSSISNITAIVGDLINLNATGEISATDPNENDTLSFSYSAPFNSSGLWQTSVNDTGNYSILVEVSDGNLSSYQYIDVIVFNSTAQLVNNLTDGSTAKLLNYSVAGNQTVQIRLPKNSNVIYSKITLEGLSS